MRPRRWNYQSIQPLYNQWRAGASLKTLAETNGSSSGRLRKIMVFFGFEMIRENHNSNVGRPRLSPAHNNTIEYFRDRPKSVFNAEAHRESRHYKGTFTL